MSDPINTTSDVSTSQPTGEEWLNETLSSTAPAATGDDLDKTMFEGMIRGEMYHWTDPYITKVASERRQIVRKLNKLDDDAERMELARTFFDVKPDSDFFFLLPMFAEYGFNIHVGNSVFIGPNSTMLDVTSITIGDNVLIGPNCSFFTATHPLSPEERNGTKGKEYSKPIKIGNDTWLGGNVVVCPGVTIGNGVTVGAGSVVTKDVPDRVLVAGNPAKVIKHL